MTGKPIPGTCAALRKGLSAKWLARLPSHLPGYFAYYRAVQECSTTAVAACKNSTPDYYGYTACCYKPWVISSKHFYSSQKGKHCLLMVLHSVRPVIDSSTTVICTKGTVIGVSILAHIFAVLKDDVQLVRQLGRKHLLVPFLGVATWA